MWLFRSGGINWRVKMNSRFDSRTKETFKKDIKFGTRMESYWWNRWLNDALVKLNTKISDPRDNGCGNDGEFIESGNTAGADFMASIAYEDREETDLPIELKFVPTAGKFTLKQNDLKAYIREGAAILFVYNAVACGTDLRKPKDHNFERHIALIESKMDQFKWGLMWPDAVDRLYEDALAKDKFQPIRYMGNKMGIVLPSSEFDLWFTQEGFHV